MLRKFKKSGVAAFLLVAFGGIVGENVH